MKNLWKNISVIAIAIIGIAAIGVTTVYANTTTPSSVTVKRAEVLSDAITNHEYGFVYFTTTDGDALYCMDNLKDPLHTGDVAKLADTADAGIQYILENTYPAKPTTDSPEFDKYLAQAAIWWYLDDTNQGDNQLSDEFRNADASTDIYRMIPDYIKPLVEKAKKAKFSDNTPSMTVKAGNKKFVLTSDKKYYESALISASLVNSDKYTVKLSDAPEGTTLVNTNGKEQTSFKSDEGFKVRIPASKLTETKNLSVNFEATGKVKKAKIYKTNDSSRQRVVGLFEDVTPLKTSVKLTANPVKKVCEVEDGKYYGKNGNVVDEKTYKKECKNSCEVIDDVFYGKDGNVVDEQTYNDECKNICVVVDDNFYGKDGNIVDEQTYNDECKNICTVADGNYYGNDGNIVDKDTYDAECGVTVVAPNTSANASVLFLILGGLLVATGLGLIIYRTKKSYL